MSDALSMVVPIVLGIVILVAERWRQPRWLALDFMRFTSAVYFMAFVVVPLYLSTVDLRSFPERSFDWVFTNPFGSEPFALASTTSLVAYLCIVAGYHRGMRRPRRTPVSNGRPTRGGLASLSPGYVMFAGVVLAIVGGGALLLYVSQIGGWLVFLISGVAARGGEPPTESAFAFLKNVALFSLSASFCFYAVTIDERRRGRRAAAMVMLAATVVMSLAILFHHAGRLQLVAYLVSFPTAGAVRRGGIRARTVVLGLLGFAALVLFGRQLFLVVSDPGLLARQWASLRTDSFYALNLFLLEFAFPDVTLANVIVSVPTREAYRWFLDFPLAVVYLIPQRLFNIRHTPSVSTVNTSLFGDLLGGIPVDVVSLGYFSAGIVGVVIVAFGFGRLVAVCERRLPATRSGLGSIVRASSLFFVAFRVMYADPVQVMMAGIYLVALAALLVAPFVWDVLRPDRVLRPGQVDSSGISPGTSAV